MGCKCESQKSDIYIILVFGSTYSEKNKICESLKNDYKFEYKSLEDIINEDKRKNIIKEQIKEISQEEKINEIDLKEIISINIEKVIEKINLLDLIISKIKEIGPEQKYIILRDMPLIKKNLNNFIDKIRMINAEICVVLNFECECENEIKIEKQKKIFDDKKIEYTEMDLNKMINKDNEMIKEIDPIIKNYDKINKSYTFKDIVYDELLKSVKEKLEELNIKPDLEKNEIIETNPEYIDVPTQFLTERDE